MIVAINCRLVPDVGAGRTVCIEEAYCAFPKLTCLPSTRYEKAYRREVTEPEESTQFRHARVNAVVRAYPEEGVTEHEPPAGAEGTIRVAVAIATEVSERLLVVSIESVKTWVDPGTNVE